MSSKQSEVIVLGGGCFWCLDSAYKIIKGVIKVEEGYSGGTTKNPSDEQIYSESTGHAEVVRVTYDPKIISLEDILDIFWTIHDPTSLNAQGYDIGPQYRSIIFYSDEDQKRRIEASKQQAQKVWNNSIVTEVALLTNFYPAPEYQKNYEINRPDYCNIIINPKLKKLREKFTSLIA